MWNGVGGAQCEGVALVVYESVGLSMGTCV